MNDREKKLALAVGVAVLLWASNVGWKKYQTVLVANQNRQLQVAQELSEAKTAALRGRRAQGRLRKWNQQSLPTDPDFARSLYQDWLRERLTAVGLKVRSLDVSTPRTSSNSYQQFSFTVGATGTLEELTAFLYSFYKAKHLHRVSQTTLATTDSGKSLTIGLTIDALSLPEAERTDELAAGTVDAFQRPLRDFQASIGRRNPFIAYETPTAVTAEVEKPPQDDEASQAQFSGIHYGENGWLMVIRLQNSGKLLYFREGDEIRVGQFRGRVQRLDGSRRNAVISLGSKLVELRFGRTLGQTVPLDGQAS
ncbi:MAG: hypothetical protein AAGD11_02110 [Planctomycetota bacterium]